jgi:lysozyme family protein
MSKVIDDLIRREGDRYTNRPNDRGGPTKYGITQKTLAEYRGHPVTPEDVAALEETEARAIYSLLYIERPKFNLLSDPLSEFMIDSGVQHGTRRVSRWLQSAASLPQGQRDGVIGNVTLAAVHQAGEAAVYRRVLARRCQFYGRIITNDPTQSEYAAGWANRLAEFIEIAP